MNSSDDRKPDNPPRTRMGLLNERGEPEQDVIAVLSRVYAALFYETLRDSFFEDTERILNFLAPLMEAQQSMEYGEAFFLLCASYEALSQPVPETVRAISGHAALESTFAVGFVRRLAEFCEPA